MTFLNEAATIASRLIENKEFFAGTMCKVLDEVAQLRGLSPLTKDEAASIHSELSFTVRFKGAKDAYMKCSLTGNIEISQVVRLIFSCKFTCAESTMTLDTAPTMYMIPDISPTLYFSSGFEKSFLP
jgi:hypothetical protein